MPLLTLIARGADGLLLCASLEAVENSVSSPRCRHPLLPIQPVSQGGEELSKKAKAILRTLNPNSPSPMQLDAGAYYFLCV